MPATTTAPATAKNSAHTVSLLLTDDETGLLTDALHEFRDRLAATVERFDLAAQDSETLPPAPGTILAALMDADRLLYRLEAA